MDFHVHFFSISFKHGATVENGHPPVLSLLRQQSLNSYLRNDWKQTFALFPWCLKFSVVIYLDKRNYGIKSGQFLFNRNVSHLCAEWCFQRLTWGCASGVESDLSLVGIGEELVMPLFLPSCLSSSCKAWGALSVVFLQVVQVTWLFSLILKGEDSWVQRRGVIIRSKSAVEFHGPPHPAQSIDSCIHSVLRA